MQIFNYECSIEQDFLPTGLLVAGVEDGREHFQEYPWHIL